MDVDFLTPAERDIFKGIKSKRAKAITENIVRKAVGVALEHEVEVEFEDGTRSVVTNAEILAARVVNEAIDNPNTSKLKDIAHIMGEDKMTVEAKVETGTDIFLGIVKDNDDSST